MTSDYMTTQFFLWYPLILCPFLWHCNPAGCLPFLHGQSSATELRWAHTWKTLPSVKKSEKGGEEKDADKTSQIHYLNSRFQNHLLIFHLGMLCTDLIGTPIGIHLWRAVFQMFIGPLWVQRKASAEPPTEFIKLRIRLSSHSCVTAICMLTLGEGGAGTISPVLKIKLLSFIKSLFVALQLLLANTDKLVGLVGWFWQGSLLLQVLLPLICPFQQVLLNWQHLKNNKKGGKSSIQRWRSRKLKCNGFYFFVKFKMYYQG